MEVRDHKENWALKNWCFWTVVLEKTLESPLDCKEIQPVHPKGDQSWLFFGGTDAKGETPVLWPPQCEELTHWKRLWCWEGLGAEGKGDNRGWDGWMAPQTRWTWVWVNSGSWWWTGGPGVLRFMGSQSWTWLRDWTELRVVIAFLPRRKRLLISWLQSPFAMVLKPKKIKSVTVSIFSPSICPEVMGPNSIIFVFWVFSIKSAFHCLTIVHGIRKTLNTT